MSTPKVGDCVRITAEGTVRQCFANGELRLVDGGTYAAVGVYGVVSIEVIPEPFVLPTKRYAQVRLGDRYFWWTRKYLDSEVGTTGMAWVAEHGQVLSSEKLLMLSGLRVISEGVSE